MDNGRNWFRKYTYGQHVYTKLRITTLHNLTPVIVVSDHTQGGLVRRTDNFGIHFVEVSTEHTATHHF